MRIEDQKILIEPGVHAAIQHAPDKSGAMTTD
jgi:hypothetical protein